MKHLRTTYHHTPAVGGERGLRAAMIRSSYRGQAAAIRRTGGATPSDALCPLAAAVRRHVGALYLPPPERTKAQKAEAKRITKEIAKFTAEKAARKAERKAAR